MKNTQYKIVELAINCTFVIALLMLNSSVVHAASSCGRAWVGGSSTHPTVNFGTLAVSGTMVIGDVIATKLLPMDNAICTGTGETGSFLYRMSGTLTALPNVYTTNVAGVGVRVLPGADKGNTQYAPFDVTGGPVSPRTYVQNQLQVELIKTGPIAVGVALSGVFYNGSATLSGFGSDAAFTGGTFKNVSCSTQAETHIRLLHVNTRDLMNVGATANEKPFTLNFNCSGAGTANVYITFSDNTTPGNTSNKLTPATTSTSSGVAFQILKSGSAISFGPNSSTFGNVNQIALGPASALTSLPLSVRYIRTGDMTPGKLTAVATFTMSYQ